MTEVTKEEVYHALARIQEYIYSLSDEDFKMFVIGKPIFGAMMPPRFHLTPLSMDQDIKRMLTRLELRIS